MKSVKQSLALAGLLCVFQFASAQTWTQTVAPAEEWLSIASSADGSKLAAAAPAAGSFPGSIFTSTNSGSTWITNNLPTFQGWQSVASSADGSILGAVATYENIYISTNSGAVWTPSQGAPGENWYSIACSEDGTKFVAAPYDDLSGNPLPIYISTNSGATWAATTSPTNNWTAVCSSADGTTLAASTFDGPIYVSTNAGCTWATNHSPVAYWKSLASSADGTKLIAGAAPSFYFYTSTNSGITWQSNTPGLFIYKSSTFVSVASSANGNILAVAGFGNDSYPNQIFVSTNSGKAWASQGNVPTNAGPTWQGIASSADGGKLAAAAYQVGIWTGQSMQRPKMNIATINGDTVLSWIIPSTNFSLRESSDLAHWTDSTNPMILNPTNLEDQVTLPATNSSMFFRLAMP